MYVTKRYLVTALVIVVGILVLVALQRPSADPSPQQLATPLPATPGAKGTSGTSGPASTPSGLSVANFVPKVDENISAPAGWTQNGTMARFEKSSPTYNSTVKVTMRRTIGNIAESVAALRDGPDIDYADPVPTTVFGTAGYLVTGVGRTTGTGPDRPSYAIRVYIAQVDGVVYHANAWTNPEETVVDGQARELLAAIIAQQPPTMSGALPENDVPRLPPASR